MTEEQKKTMEALEKKVLMRCRESNKKVSPLELRKLIREEWEKMQAEKLLT